MDYCGFTLEVHMWSNLITLYPWFICKNESVDSFGQWLSCYLLYIDENPKSNGYSGDKVKKLALLLFQEVATKFLAHFFSAGSLHDLKWQMIAGMFTTSGLEPMAIATQTSKEDMLQLWLHQKILFKVGLGLQSSIGIHCLSKYLITVHCCINTRHSKAESKKKKSIKVLEKSDQILVIYVDGIQTYIHTYVHIHAAVNWFSFCLDVESSPFSLHLIIYLH